MPVLIIPVSMLILHVCVDTTCVCILISLVSVVILHLC